MAYITITANTEEGQITLHERVGRDNMESEFYCAHLVQRLRWAVEDAHAAPSRADLDGEDDRPDEPPGAHDRPADEEAGDPTIVRVRTW